MKQLKVGTRLALGFALVLVMLLAVIVLGIAKLGALNDGTRVMALDAYPKVVVAQNLADRVNRTARTVRDLLLLDEPEANKKNLAALATSRREADEMFGQLDKLVVSETGVKNLRAYRAAYAQYIDAVDQVLKLHAAGEREAAIALLLGPARKLQSAVFIASNEVIEHQGGTMQATYEAAEQTYAAGRNAMLVLGALALLGDAVAATLITRTLLRQLGAAPGATAPAPAPLQWIRAAQGQETRLIAIDEVIYFQSNDKYTSIFLQDGESLIRTPLSKLKEQLDPQQFWQIHRGVIVAARHVAGTRTDFRGRLHVRLKGREEQLVVSRNYVDLFRQM